jgi:CheY-like chemotaxis protein
MSLLTFLTHFADPRQESPDTHSPISEVRAIALVIDDDPGMRSLMTLSLEQCGYQVLAAPSGAEAIALAQSLSRIDLVVVDLELHGVQGPAVVHSLRAMTGYMPVVYVSERTAGLVGVADPVLRKPFLCGDWLNTVADVVGVLPKDKSIAAA